MKRSIALLLLLPLCLTLAAEPASLLVRASKKISAPDLRQPLGPEWSVAKGQWTPADGVLTATDLPAEKHIPVLHLKTGPVSLVMDCEFRLTAGKSFLVGCDSTKHVGRLIITEKSAKLAEDSTEVKGKTPSHVLTEAKVDLKAGDWQTLHLEYAGDQIAVLINGQELKAEHEYLATPKLRWWFAAGDQVQVRKVSFSEGEPK